MNIAIVDDQEVYRKQIRDLINQKKGSFNIGEFSSGEELFCSKNCFYDIYFLDIVMNGNNGVEVAAKIRESNENAILFFVTSHTSYISDALKNQPFQYLIKPINEKLFLEEFERAFEYHKSMRRYLTVESNGYPKKMLINDICYCESNKRKINIYMSDGEVVNAKGKIADYMKDLKDIYFVRTHNSFLINLRMINYIKNYTIFTKYNYKVPISKKYLDMVKKSFRDYITGVSL